MLYDLIIIGSGPAGLSAAVYGSRAGLTVLVLEEKAMSGGQVLNTYEVDNYLGLPGINGFDMGMKFREHVATGAEHAVLDVPGEAEYKGKGVSYCATCDGAFFKGRDVAVVGGGDVAVEDAIYLARMCRKVWLIHRRDSLRAARSLQQKLTACDNVEILWNRTLSKITGTDLVEKITLRSVTDQTEEELPAEGVFIAVGMHPNTRAFAHNIPCDEKGYVIAGEDCVTKVPGIFAAGDIRTKQVRQIITAVADGACAVASAEQYLNEN